MGAVTRRQLALACALIALAPSPARAWPARTVQAGPTAERPAGVGSPMIGDAQIAPGLWARYEYHFNRNALRDSRNAGTFFVALTEAGNVLSFGGESLQPIAALVEPIPATALGQDDTGAVLVGYRDGRLIRVNASTLSST